MEIALDTSGNRVDAKIAEKTQTYTCPICGEIVVPKAISSKSVCPHFAHKSKSLCDEWKSDMSEWHYNWQEKFPVECREVVLENCGIKHRADVLINNFVIEFQHSPISEEEFNARNSFYLGCGKNLIWIFDMTDKIKLPNENSCCLGNGSTLKLSRMRSYLRDYRQAHGYGLFFQDGNTLFLILGEEFDEFNYFNVGIKLTQDAFLKDFGCCDRSDLSSVGELFANENNRLKQIRTNQEIINRIKNKARDSYLANSLLSNKRSWKKRRF